MALYNNSSCCCNSNFYFFYMLVFTTIIYVIVRFIFCYGKNVKMWGKGILRLAVSSVTGLCMAAIVFLPVLHVFLSDRDLIHLTKWDWYILFHTMQSFRDFLSLRVIISGHAWDLQSCVACSAFNV